MSDNGTQPDPKMAELTAKLQSVAAALTTVAGFDRAAVLAFRGDSFFFGWANMDAGQLQQLGCQLIVIAYQMAQQKTAEATQAEAAQSTASVQ